MANKIAKIQKGTIILKWKGGKEITIACTVEDEEYIEHDSFIADGMGELESAKVIYGNENETYPLCLECQTHLLKHKIIECPEGSGQLEEVLECTNPDCPNKA